MYGGMLQILITVWLGVHPVTYMLPQQYPVTDRSCPAAVDRLISHRKPKSYRSLRIECVPAIGAQA